MKEIVLRIMTSAHCNMLECRQLMRRFSHTAILASPKGPVILHFPSLKYISALRGPKNPGFFALPVLGELVYEGA